MIRTSLLLLGLFAGPGQAAEICIANETGKALFMVADDRKGGRAAQIVPSGDSLCLQVPDDLLRGSVSAFLNEDVIEGCSRLTRPGQREVLRIFHAFDACSWAPTQRGFYDFSE